MRESVVAGAPDAQLAAVRRLCGEVESLAGAARRAPPLAETANYGILDDSTAAFHDLLGTVRQLMADLKPTAAIRTTLDGECAITVVTYLGSATSAWSTDPSAELAETQLRSVQRVLAMRSAMARAVVAAGSAMVALSAAVANPLALPYAIASARSLQQALQRLMTAAEAAA